MRKELEKTFRLEGGYSDRKNDDGGATYCGLSLAYMTAAGDRDKNGTLDFDLDHDGKVDAADVKLLTKDEVEMEFLDHFWAPMRLGEINSVRIRWKIFDLAINLGMGRAARYLQNAANCEPDGVIGSVTIARVNAQIVSGLGEHVVMDRIIEQQAKHYVERVIEKPSNLANLRGWIKRAFDRGEDLL